MPERRAPRRAASAPTLLRAKLQPPNPDAAAIERPQLVEALERHASRPLSLLIADAGWGKTTLAASFARHGHRPVVWYGLQLSDGDLRVFGRHLLEGFRADQPRFGGTFARLLEETKPGARGADVLGETFAQALAEMRGPVRLLVLDDFQAVEGSTEVLAFTTALLRLLPGTVRVLITTRTAPSLPLERMRVRGDLFELDAAQLRLERGELAQLFGARLGRPIAEHELERLDEATMGWPTAVQLVLEALHRAPTRTLDDVLAELRVPDLHLQAFFSAEVYRRLEPETRGLLESTATMERFDVPLATALSNRRDARAQLAALAKRGLVRTFGAGAAATYEWHGLVRAFVRQEIESRDGAEAWRALELAAARALRARGESERALRHALDAGARDLASELLGDLAPRLLREGRAAALLGFLGDAPGVADADVALALADADARAALGRWDEAERQFGVVLERARGAGLREIECRALLGLGKVLNLRGHHERVLGMSERQLADAKRLPLELRARLLQMKASAHFYLGQHRAAIEILDQVRALLPADADPELVVPALHNQAIAYAAQGRFREASDGFRSALTQVRGTSSPRAPLYLSNLAFLLIELGDIDEARHTAEEGLAAAQRFSNRAQEATCLEALAECLTQTGDLDGALAALRRAEDLHDQLRMEVIRPDLLAARGRIFCARGQYRRAVDFLSQAIEREAARPDAPRLTAFRAQLAWCELRAGRPHAAKQLLAPLIAAVARSENDDERMRVHWWLAEALLALGERAPAEPHLKTALGLVRERGYAHFLRLRAREEPAPLVAALARGIEVDVCAAALAEAGAAAEEALLVVAETAPLSAAEAALTVLGETGGALSVSRIPAIARKRRRLAEAARAALRQAETRTRPVAAAGQDGVAAAARLVLFGPPCIEVSGRTLPSSAWRAQRAFHVLLLLALRPRGASRDELLETFWPGRLAAAGRRNFHPTLSYIRSVLPRHASPPLLRQVETYQLNPDYPLTCDLWEFEAALEAARRTAGDEDKRALLERAIALAERPALEGVYGRWAEETQNRLRDRLETLRLEAGKLARAAGDLERAHEHFRRAADLDEFRESTRVAVIECLVALGNRAAALSEYERMRTELRRALGVDPLPETEAACRKVLGIGATARPQIRQPQGA